MSSGREEFVEYDYAGIAMDGVTYTWYSGPELNANKEKLEGWMDVRYLVLRKPLNMTRQQCVRSYDFDEPTMHLLAEYQKDNGPEVTLGVVSLYPLRRSEHPHKYKLYQMAVVDPMQSRGLGSMMVQRVIHRVRSLVESDTKYILLVCAARYYAVPFYEHNGFNVTGEPFEEVGMPHRHMELPVWSADSSHAGVDLAWDAQRDGGALLGPPAALRSWLNARRRKVKRKQFAQVSGTQLTGNARLFGHSSGKSRGGKKKLTLEEEGYVKYTVSDSDTLAGIALRTGMGMAELKRVNEDLSNLYPGQEIYITSSSSSSSGNSSSSTGDAKPGRSSSGSKKPKFGASVISPKTRSASESEADGVELEVYQAKVSYCVQSVRVMGEVTLTPSYFIFMPSLTDPYVRERGQQPYTLNFAMSAVASATFVEHLTAETGHVDEDDAKVMGAAKHTQYLQMIVRTGNGGGAMHFFAVPNDSVDSFLAKMLKFIQPYDQVWKGTRDAVIESAKEAAARAAELASQGKRGGMFGRFTRPKRTSSNSSVNSQDGSSSGSFLWGSGKSQDESGSDSNSVDESNDADGGSSSSGGGESGVAAAGGVGKAQTRMARVDSYDQLFSAFEVKVHGEGDCLLDDELVGRVCKYLPRRLQRSHWKLVYSTAVHGISLRTLYNNCTKAGPVVTLVQDRKGYVFGAFTTDGWNHRHEGYYGTGESFVFKAKPDFEVFSWTRKNNYVMLAEEHSLAIGGGGDGFSIFLNEDLEVGSSRCSDTFGNECLASEEDFLAVVVQVYKFGKSNY